MEDAGFKYRTIVNNISVSYNDQGSKNAPGIIFIHGFPFNKTMWNKQTEVLKNTFRVVNYDIRGHGESERGTETYSIDLFVNDLINFMDNLSLEKASLCGLSMGGYIALNAVENYPERFNALVFCDTQCMADSPEAKERRIKSIEEIQHYGVKKYAEESIKNFFTQESFSTKVTEIEDAKQMIVNTSEQSLCMTLSALMNRKETCSGLSKINVPVLILVGKDDKITPVTAAEIMVNGIRNSLLKVIDHAGHLSCLENPEAFNNQLTSFFTSVHKKELE